MLFCLGLALPCFKVSDHDSRFEGINVLGSEFLKRSGLLLKSSEILIEIDKDSIIGRKLANEIKYK